MISACVPLLLCALFGQASCLSIAKLRRTRGLVPRAFVLAIDHEKGKRVQDMLPAAMLSETVIGFNASKAPELRAAVELLSDAKVNHAVSLAWIGAGMLCMHTTEHGTFINEPTNLFRMQKYKEFWQQLHSDMASLAHHHPCMGLDIVANAGHMKIWQTIAQQNGDSWYMILEDDVQFCPGWFDRMAEDLERAPDDADILKLYWFAGSPATSKDVFAKVHPVPLGDGISNCSDPACEIKELVSITSSIATYTSPRYGEGVRASAAAYLIRPSSARKMLARFSHADMSDMDLMMPHLGNVYVWNNVLATPRESTSKFLVLHHYAPSCHAKRTEIAGHVAAPWSDREPIVEHTKSIFSIVATGWDFCYQSNDLHYLHSCISPDANPLNRILAEIRGGWTVVNGSCEDYSPSYGQVSDVPNDRYVNCAQHKNYFGVDLCFLQSSHPSRKPFWYAYHSWIHDMLVAAAVPYIKDKFCLMGRVPHEAPAAL